MKIALVFDWERDVRPARRIARFWKLKAGCRAAMPDDRQRRRLLAGSEADRRRGAARQVAAVPVAVLLIGSGRRPPGYLLHAVRTAHQREKGIVGLRVHRIADRDRRPPPGANPLARLIVRIADRETPLDRIYPVYDWLADGGRFHLHDWVRRAAGR